MSTSTVTPPTTPTTSRTTKLHATDWIFIVIIGALIIGYIVYVLVNIQGDDIFDWGAFFNSFVVGTALLIAGVYMVRNTESHGGEASFGELGGMNVYALGVVLVLFAVLPHVVKNQLEEHARPVKPPKDLDPPVLNVVVKDNVKTVDVARLGSVADKDKTRVFILITQSPELLNNELRSSLKLPPDVHGKVWYELEGGRRSLAQDY